MRAMEMGHGAAEAEGRVPMYGYLSGEAAGMFGTLRYGTPGGGVVEVTGVGREENPAEAGYGFTDAVCVGEVTWFAGGVMSHPMA